MTPTATIGLAHRKLLVGLFFLLFLLARPDIACAQESSVEKFLEGARRFLKQQGEAIQSQFMVPEKPDRTKENAKMDRPPLPLENPRREEILTDTQNPAAGTVEPEQAQTAIPLPMANPLRTGALDAAPVPEPPPHPGEAAMPDWTEREIAKAQARCARLLKKAGAVYTPMDAVREGRCGTPAPVEVSAVGVEQTVAIDPPATLTCEMTAALARWLDSDVQPAARAYLDSPVVKIRNIASYVCRNRYNDADARISEHARANALDTPGFETEGGDVVRVEDHWRETIPPPLRKSTVSSSASTGSEKTVKKAVPATRTRGGKPDGAKPEKPAEDSGERPPGSAAPAKPAEPVLSSRAEFLRNIHGSACLVFGTVLGPKANAAHANHFHLDMAEREYGNYCE